MDFEKRQTKNESKKTEKKAIREKQTNGHYLNYYALLTEDLCLYALIELRSQ